MSLFQRTFRDLKEHGPSTALALLLMFVVLLTPLPYVRSSPGSTYPVISQSDDAVVQVSDSKEFPVGKPNGTIRMLTVAQWGGPYGSLTWLDAIRALIDRTIFVVPTEFLFAPATDPDAVEAQSAMQFASAESLAVGAAMKYLGIDVREETAIGYINPKAPSADALKVGDVILAADGIDFDSMQAFSDFMQKHPAGTAIDLTLKRGDEKIQREVMTFKDEQSDRALIGISVFPRFFPPMPISFRSSDVGGPSAGLAMTLSIVQQLSQEDFIKGRDISVTGEIRYDSSVGAIGGLTQKFASAARDGSTLMLFPRENCEDLPDEIPAELTIVPVSNLKEAIEVLREPKVGLLPRC